MDERFRKARKAANILRQVFHSQSCGGHCGKPQCLITSRLLVHMRDCKETICAMPGCSTTRKLLAHFKTCQLDEPEGDDSDKPRNFCLICTLATSSFSKDSALLQRIATALSTSPAQKELSDGPQIPYCQPVVGTEAVYSSSQRSATKACDDSETTRSSTGSPTQTKRRCVSESQVEEVYQEEEKYLFERKSGSGLACSNGDPTTNQNSFDGTTQMALRNRMREGTQSSLLSISSKMKTRRDFAQYEAASSFDSVELQESYSWKAFQAPIVREQGMTNHTVTWNDSSHRSKVYKLHQDKDEFNRTDDLRRDKSVRWDDGVQVEALDSSTEYIISLTD